MHRSVLTVAVVGLAAAAGILAGAVTLGGHQTAGFGIVRGVVVDDRGVAVPGAMLTLHDKSAPSIPAGATTTAIDGRWEFGGLAAGRYGLLVQKDGHVNTDVTAPESIPLENGRTRDLTLRLIRTGVIEGVVLDQFDEPIPGASISATRAGASEMRFLEVGTGNATSAGGRFRIHGLRPGTYVVSSRGSRTQVPVRDADGRLVWTFPTFHPAAIDPRQGTPVSVVPGGEVAGITIQLTPRPVGTIDVDLIDTSPLEIDMAVAEWHPADRIDGEGNSSGDADRDQSGRLALTNVPAGHQMVAVRAFHKPEPGGTRPLPVWGYAEVTSTASHTRVSVTLQPGSIITAQVAVDGGTPLAGLTRLQPRLVAVSSPFSDRARAWIRSRSLPFGFEIAGVPPGDYRLEFIGLPEGLAPVSAMLDGQDVMDGSIRVFPGRDIDGLVVTLTDRMASVSGVLIGPDGAPRFDMPIVVFPVDAALRTTHSRRIVKATPDIDGRFVVDGLPPGAYLVTAIEPGWDPSFEPERLTAVEGTAQPVQLDLGQGVHVRITRPRGP